MAGVALEVALETAQAARLAARFRELRERFANLEPLLEAVGAEVESQTRRRLAEEKRGPDGEPWPAWSAAYAAGRHGGHSLLRSEGGLLDSIRHEAGPEEAVIGSNLVYAAIHQFGGADAGQALPARPYLGLAAEDEADLAALLESWAEGRLREALA